MTGSQTMMLHNKPVLNMLLRAKNGQMVGSAAHLVSSTERLQSGSMGC